VKAEELSNQPAWYIPHHPVFHLQKPNKVRVIFDCSAKQHGTSLNDQLLQRLDLTNTLVIVLTRFRQEPVALMSDIEAMFYQVRVRPSDCSYGDGSDVTKQPEEHQMLVHLFQVELRHLVVRTSPYVLRQTITEQISTKKPYKCGTKLLCR